MNYQYIQTNDAELTSLNEVFHSLAAAWANVEQRHRDLKTARGNCPKQPDRDNDRHLDLEREHEQAWLRLSAAVTTMHPLLQPVQDAAQALRLRCDEADEPGWCTEGLIRANNVMAAEQLYERGCQFYFREFLEIRRPHFFRLRDDWKQPRPDRVFVVCGHPGNELDQFVYDMPSAPYCLKSEADAEVGRSLGDSGWYQPHVYDVREHSKTKSDLETRRNPKPSQSQQTRIDRAMRQVRTQIAGKTVSRDGITVTVPDHEEIIVMCVARTLREEGWQVRDHFQHGYGLSELWLSKSPTGTATA